MAIVPSHLKESVRDRFVETRRSAQNKKALLRIRFNLTSVPELARLPWEYIHNSEQNKFYARDRRPITTVVRYLDLGEPIEELLVASPLRVLVMVSKPADAAHLQVDIEWDQLQRALGKLVERGLVQIDLLPAATLPALVEGLQKAKEARRPYHVFHFIGHGVFDPTTNEGRLLFEDEHRQSRQVSAEKLGNRLREYNLRLAVINACEGARIAETDSYTGLAPLLCQTALIPAVVAMQFKITDQAAIVFARSFYSAIAGGQPVDSALTQARLDVYSDDKLDESNVEWATPVLYMRTKNSYLLKLQPGDYEPPEPGIAHGSVPITTSPSAQHPLEGHFQFVVRQLLEGQLAPYLGLDINLFGRELVDNWFPGSPGQKLPGSREMAAYLSQRFGYPGNVAPDLLQVTQYAMTHEDYGEAELYDALVEVFRGDHAPTPLHQFLARAPKLLREKGYPIKKDDPTRQRFVVVTNNLDNLLESAFRTELSSYHVVSYQARGGEQGKFLHSKFLRASDGQWRRQLCEVVENGEDYPGFAHASDVDPIILKLPGTLDLLDARRKFDFAITEDHYFDYLMRKEVSTLLPAAILNKLRRSSNLFLGCSLHGWNLRALLYRIWDNQRPPRKSWAVIRKESAPAPQVNLEKQFWAACKVERVPADLPDYVAELNARIESVASADPAASTGGRP